MLELANTLPSLWPFRTQSNEQSQAPAPSEQQDTATQQPFPLEQADNDIQKLFFNQFLPRFLSSQDQIHLAQVNKLARTTLNSETHQERLIEKALLEELIKCKEQIDLHKSNMLQYFHDRALRIAVIPLLSFCRENLKYFVGLSFSELLQVRNYLEPYRTFFDHSQLIEGSVSSFILKLMALFELSKENSNWEGVFLLYNKIPIIHEIKRDERLVYRALRLHFFPNEAEQKCTLYSNKEKVIKGPIDELNLIAKDPDLSSLILLSKLPDSIQKALIQKAKDEKKNIDLRCWVAFNLAPSDPKTALELISPIESFSKTLTKFLPNNNLNEFIQHIYNYDAKKAWEFVNNTRKDPSISKFSQLRALEAVTSIFPNEIARIVESELAEWFKEPTQTTQIYTESQGQTDYLYEIFRAILLLGSIKPETLIPNLIRFREHLGSIPYPPKNWLTVGAAQSAFCNQVNHLQKWILDFSEFPKALFNHPTTIIQLCRTPSLKLSSEVKFFLLLETIRVLSEANSQNHLLEQARELLEPLWEASNLKIKASLA